MERTAIDPTNPVYDRALMLAAGLARERRLALFAGAGVSAPSGLPMSPGLKEGLIDAMRTALGSTGTSREGEWAQIERVLSAQPLEALLDSLVDTHGSRALAYLDVLLGASVNVNHAAPAALAARGLLDTVVTLNFDTLFQQAILDAGVGLRLVLPLAAYDAGFGDAAECMTVVKPHGTLPQPGLPYETRFLAPTLRYAGDRPQPENRRVLSRVASRHEGLVVCGYGGRDWDIIPILASLKWSVVFWVQYARASSGRRESAGRLSEQAIQWLQSARVGRSFCLDGDPRDFLCDLLEALGIPVDAEGTRIARGCWTDVPTREPDRSFLLDSPGRTALSAVKLLDGSSNVLYGKYLDRFSKVPPYRLGESDHPSWLRLVAWYLHAHRRDIRGAIRVWRKIEFHARQGDRPSLERLGDVLSLYYERLSAAKRPFLNPRWVLDLAVAARLGRTLRREAREVKLRHPADPWVDKQVERYTALAKYYVTDLAHNWGYHLLLFHARPVRRLTRVVFKRVTASYARLVRRYRVLDWEYHYVRRLEARLLSQGHVAGRAADRRLSEIEQMFCQTGAAGHAENARAVRAILHRCQGDPSAYEEFVRARDALVDGRDVTTPSAKVRMLLFERYFWPEKVGFLTAVRGLLRHSARQSEGTAD